MTGKWKGKWQGQAGPGRARFAMKHLSEKDEAKRPKKGPNSSSRYEEDKSSRHFLDFQNGQMIDIGEDYNKESKKPAETIPKTVVPLQLQNPLAETMEEMVDLGANLHALTIKGPDFDFFKQRLHGDVNPNSGRAGYDAHCHINKILLAYNRSVLKPKFAIWSVCHQPQLKDFCLDILNVPEGVGLAVGIHPSVQLEEKFQNQLLEKMNGFRREQKLFAVGEAGIDLACAVPLNVQERTFAIMIKKAQELQLTLHIHAKPSDEGKSATENVLKVLAKEDPNKEVWIYWHMWNAPVQDMMDVLRVYRDKVVFGFSQSLYTSPEQIKCFMFAPLGQTLLETDSTGYIPKSLDFGPAASKSPVPGNVWFLTLWAAAILGMDPRKLEEYHKETMETLYGTRFDQGLAGDWLD